MGYLLAILFIILFIQENKKTKKLTATNQELSQEIANNKEAINKLNIEIEEYKALGDKAQRNEALANEKRQLEKEKVRIEKEIVYLEKELLLASSAVFSPDDNITSEEYKNQLSILRINYKELVKSDKALHIASQDSKKVINNNAKQILRCFNAECSNILCSISAQNVDTLRNKIAKTFETLNKIFETDGISLTKEVLEIRLEELRLIHAYELKKEQEREEQKAIREQMLEEEKVRREIEREKARIEKEEHQFKNEISKLMKYMQKASEIEKQLYIDKIKELEAKVSLLEKDKENVLEREQNTRAGFVYVISNIGSFGEDIYKIGMTRRLEPLDRVKELGDASVPFEFDVHAMIFSENAPDLETTLHRTFRKYEVNKVNSRKEFFRVPLDEIEAVVKESHNATVTFTKIAEAIQYRESLALAKAEANNTLETIA